jgi:hypothetical protein
MALTFFGIQLALSLPRSHALRGQLADVVRDLRACSSIPAQRPAWTRASTLLRNALPTADLGTWDLLRDDARMEYEDWASGLEAMAEWNAAEFGGGELLLATVIMLVEGGSNADRLLGDRCDLAESLWHARTTYDRLLATLPMLNFTNLHGSALYLAPRPDAGGFNSAVLTGEGFEYLALVGN